MRTNENDFDKNFNKNAYYKVSLYLVDIAPRKRKVDRNFIEIGKTLKGTKKEVLESEIAELKVKAQEILTKCKDVRKCELNFRRWSSVNDNIETMLCFDENNFDIQL